MSKPRILFFDLETTPNRMYSWGLRIPSGYLSPENIEEERTILCGSWMWSDNPTVESIAVDPAHPKDDRHVTTVLNEVMGQADAWVAHNGDNFDIRWVRTRAVYYKLPPLPPVVQIDTKKMAKRVFNFNSNRLVYLAEFLGVGKKLKTDFDLWKDCIKGDVAALEKMLRYNKRDVRLLPRVYKRLAPYISAKINMRLFTQKESCQNCGSMKTQHRGFSYTTSHKYRRLQCTSCGQWSRSQKAEKV